MGDRRQIRILIVDDSATARRHAEDLVTSLGHTVETASSGARALEMLGRGGYEMVLTDLVMPDIDGLDLLISIRRRWPELPVLMMTGHASLSSAVTALRRGIDDILIKPIYPELVAHRIDAIMEHRDARRKAAHAHKLEGALAMAGTAAHEINQPLTALMASAEMLGLTKDPERRRELITRIIDSAELLAEMTRRLADVVRFETKPYLDTTEIVDLDASSRGGR